MKRLLLISAILMTGCNKLNVGDCFVFAGEAYHVIKKVGYTKEVIRFSNNDLDYFLGDYEKVDCGILHEVIESRKQ